MKPDDTIRAGDYVTVITGESVLRVGYPKCVEDYFKEVEAKYGAQLTQDIGRGWTRNRAVRQIAYGMAKKDGFGGKTRSVHLQPEPEIVGKTFYVVQVRSVVTGDYYPPEYWGPEDSQPGGLTNRKTVRLARINHWRNFAKEMTLVPVSHLKKFVVDPKPPSVLTMGW